MAAKDTIPIIPKKPEIKTVNILIGICNPIIPPNTLKKNNNNTPIPSFTILCAKNRVGLVGAPMTNNKIIRPIIIDMTNVEFNAILSFFFVPLTHATQHDEYFYLLPMQLDKEKELLALDPVLNSTNLSMFCFF